MIFFFCKYQYNTCWWNIYLHLYLHINNSRQNMNGLTEPQTKISTFFLFFFCCCCFLHDNNTNLDIKYFLYTWAVSNIRECCLSTQLRTWNSPVWQELLFCYMCGQQLRHREARAKTKGQPYASNKITIGLNLVAHNDKI